MSYIHKERFEERLNASRLFDNFGEDGAFIRDFVIQLMDEMVEKESSSERLTKFNEETSLYEYNGVAKTHKEFMEQRKNAIQKLGELEDKEATHPLIVKCKECKFWSKHKGCPPFEYLRKCYRQYGAAMSENDYCSLGEKGEPLYD